MPNQKSKCAAWQRRREEYLRAAGRYDDLIKEGYVPPDAVERWSVIAGGRSGRLQRPGHESNSYLVMRVGSMAPERLAIPGYWITSPPDVRYNCIAWAAGDTRQWWWPTEPGPRYYWPKEVEREETLVAFMAVCVLLGFVPSDNEEVEPGFEKRRRPSRWPIQ